MSGMVQDRAYYATTSSVCASALLGADPAGDADASGRGVATDAAKAALTDAARAAN